MATTYETPLKRAISASGFSQKQLAAVIGVTEGQMSRYVRGLQPPEPRCEAIATALGREPSDLWPTAAAA